MTGDEAARAAISAGAIETGLIPTDEIQVYEEIRGICRQNACRGYGATWACPPAVGTVRECAEKIAAKDAMLLFSQKFDIEDSFDFEGMEQAMKAFRVTVDRVQERLPREEYLLLGNEGCGRCARCTYPDAPCRHPDKLHPSLEGFGLIVAELARRAGMRYNNGKNTVTFFGAVLFDLSDGGRTV